MKKKIIVILSMILVFCLSLSVAALSETEIFDFSNDTEQILQLRLVEDHPGLPGYDLVLNFNARFGVDGDMNRINNDEFTLSCDVKEVKIDENIITIPASFKDTTELDGFNVYATHNETGIKGSYPLVLKKWDLTLEDEFDNAEKFAENWEIFSLNETATGEKCGTDTYWKSCEDNVSLTTDGDKSVMKMEITRGDANTFYCANLVSKFSQTEGAFIAKIAAPTRGGCNTAFWAVPESGKWGADYFVRCRSGSRAGYADGEFDIVEYSPKWVDNNGNPYYYCSDHFFNEQTKQQMSNLSYSLKHTNPNLNGGYVEYALAWTPTGVYYYCDGELIKSVMNTETIGGAKIRLQFNPGAYNGEIDKWVGDFTDEDIPYMFAKVDYFKMYK